ncbi:unnamed protein product [Citrullus colocynthis]|uniref:Uncharacterized protein n=1 Tax=Citrullus colocynthis TaxID=252529 RepID=A0ABP0YU79_9ROSI
MPLKQETKNVGFPNPPHSTLCSSSSYVGTPDGVLTVTFNHTSLGTWHHFSRWIKGNCQYSSPFYAEQSTFLPTFSVANAENGGLLTSVISLKINPNLNASLQEDSPFTPFFRVKRSQFSKAMVVHYGENGNQL